MQIVSDFLFQYTSYNDLFDTLYYCMYIFLQEF